MQSLSAFRTRLGPSLCETWDRLLASKGAGEAQAPLKNFTRIAQPVAHLPLWVAEAVHKTKREITDEALGAAVEAAILGYLCVQGQDDLIDSDGVQANALLLAHALFCRHQTALLPLVTGHPGFWRMFEEKWLAYSEALAFKGAAQRRPGYMDAAAFQQVLRRSQPLVIPGAAVLVHLDRWDLFPALERLVRHSTTAAQLFDDLVDAQHDLLHGNHTWVVNRLGGGEGPATLGRRLYVEGGYETVIEEALRELAAAREVATHLGMESARLALERDAERMSAMRNRIVDTLARLLFDE